MCLICFLVFQDLLKTLTFSYKALEIIKLQFTKKCKTKLKQSRYIHKRSTGKPSAISYLKFDAAHESNAYDRHKM